MAVFSSWPPTFGAAECYKLACTLLEIPTLQPSTSALAEVSPPCHCVVARRSRPYQLTHPPPRLCVTIPGDTRLGCCSGGWRQLGVEWVCTEGKGKPLAPQHPRHCTPVAASDVLLYSPCSPHCLV